MYTVCVLHKVSVYIYVETTYVSFFQDYTNKLSNTLNNIHNKKNRQSAYIFIMFVYIFCFFYGIVGSFSVRACVHVCVERE